MSKKSVLLYTAIALLSDRKMSFDAAWFHMPPRNQEKDALQNSNRYDEIKRDLQTNDVSRWPW